jgi:AcrR family transcriptional regulator
MSSINLVLSFRWLLYLTLDNNATNPIAEILLTTVMKVFNSSPPSEAQTRVRILQAAQRLFASQGFDGTTTRDLAQAAGVAEGTLFRHFPNKKAILVEVATQGWVEILTDLLTELSEMGSYKAVAQVMRRRMWNMLKNADMMRVCFMEAQFHPDLRDRIQSEVIVKMTDVAEAFFQTAMDKGIYRQMDAKLVAKVFLGMFAIAGFSNNTLMEPDASPQQMQQMAEGLADIFLNGVLAKD